MPRSASPAISSVSSPRDGSTETVFVSTAAPAMLRTVSVASRAPGFAFGPQRTFTFGVSPYLKSPPVASGSR